MIFHFVGEPPDFNDTSCPDAPVTVHVPTTVCVELAAKVMTFAEVAVIVRLLKIVLPVMVELLLVVKFTKPLL